MKFCNFILLTLVIACNTGCSLFPSLQDKRDQAETKLNIVNYNLEERSKELTAAIQDTALSAKKKSEASGEPTTPEIELITVLSTEDVRIEGEPIERLNITLMLADLSKTKEALNKYKAEHIKWLRERQHLDLHIETLNKKIESSNSSWFDSLLNWFWGLGISGMIICIVLITLFPAIGFPLLQRVLSWLIGIFPKLISLIGVVGNDVVDSIIKGHEEVKKVIGDADIFKRNLQHHTADKLFTKAEVEKYLDGLRDELSKSIRGKMREQTDSNGKVHKIINQRKVDLKL